MPLKRPHLVLVAASTLFAAVFVLRLADSDPTDGVTLLFVVPVALLAIEFGLMGGLVGATASVVLLAIWTDVREIEFSLTAYLTRALAFYTLGVLVGRFVAERRRLAEESTRWFELSGDIACTAGFDGYFKRVNEAFERTVGYSRDELLARPFIEFVHPDDRERTEAEAAELAVGASTVDFQNRYRARDGSYRWLEWTATSVVADKLICASARDVTERKRAERERDELLARVEAMSRTDEVTGLPNRRAWDEELRRELARSRRSGAPVCVAAVDLDHFKQFNDEHGHPAGDTLLKELGSNWRMAVRVNDLVARYGGEEFAVLLPECTLQDASVVMERLRAATPAGQTCSVGLASWDGVESAESLVARADVALYEAKRTGRDRVATAG